MIERFQIHFTPSSDERMVSVYLPRDYASGREAYPVMYMFDGQNAFEDDQASYGKSWGLHDFLDNWNKGMIVVGLQSSPEGDRRMAEYCPYALQSSRWEGLRGRGSATMDFIAETLKPRIDQLYRTLPWRSCTGVIGGSMGGLMSLYAVTAYNDIFSKAACVSTAMSICYPQLIGELGKGSLNPDTRVYLSWGENEARDKTMLARVTAQNLAIANALMRKQTRVCPFLQQEGRHCEEDWRKQVPEFMRFLWQE